MAMRIQFVVRIFNLEIHLEHKQPNYHVKTFDVDFDFAKYKKIVFSQWRCTSSERRKSEVWKETTYTRSNPLFFRYRTDYAQFLDPKELTVDMFARQTCGGKDAAIDEQGRSILGSTAISFQVLVTGPPQYHLHITRPQENKMYEQIVLSFTCHMHQECVIQYGILSMQCHQFPLPLPDAITQHPNSYWFDPSFTAEVWYVSAERMTFAVKLVGAKQGKAITWTSSPSFYISDTTDMLDNVHLFLQISYNDRPWGYTLIPLFREFNPKDLAGEYAFRIPLFPYYSATTKEATLDLIVRIAQGPTFWQMKDGIASESCLISGTPKPHFPVPKLPSVSQLFPQIHKSKSSFPSRTQDILDTLHRAAFPVRQLTSSSTSSSSFVPRSQLMLFQLDDSQKTLLECYFHLGFSKEWVKKHINNLF